MADHTLPGVPAIRNLVAADAGLLRGLVEQTVNAILSADADALCGADWGAFAAWWLMASRIRLPAPVD